MSQNLPQDPIILLSYVNTQLRDHYATLAEFCARRWAQIGRSLKKSSGTSITSTTRSRMHLCDLFFIKVWIFLAVNAGRRAGSKEGSIRSPRSGRTTILHAVRRPSAWARIQAAGQQHHQLSRHGDDQAVALPLPSAWKTEFLQDDAEARRTGSCTADDPQRRRRR